MLELKKVFKCEENTIEKEPKLSKGTEVKFEKFGIFQVLIVTSANVG